MAAHQRTVFFVGEQAAAEGMPKAFIGTPFIIDEDGALDARTTEYLLARRNGDWSGPHVQAGVEAELSGNPVHKASPLYLRSRAYQLDSYRCPSSG